MEEEEESSPMEDIGSESMEVEQSEEEESTPMENESSSMEEEGDEIALIRQEEEKLALLPVINASARPSVQLEEDLSSKVSTVSASKGPLTPQFTPQSSRSSVKSRSRNPSNGSNRSHSSSKRRKSRNGKSENHSRRGSKRRDSKAHSQSPETGNPNRTKATDCYRDEQGVLRAPSCQELMAEVKGLDSGDCYPQDFHQRDDRYRCPSEFGVERVQNADDELWDMEPINNVVRKLNELCDNSRLQMMQNRRQIGQNRVVRPRSMSSMSRCLERCQDMCGSANGSYGSNVRRVPNEMCRQRESEKELEVKALRKNIRLLVHSSMLDKQELRRELKRVECELEDAEAGRAPRDDLCTQGRGVAQQFNCIRKWNRNAPPMGNIQDEQRVSWNLRRASIEKDRMSLRNREEKHRSSCDRYVRVQAKRSKKRRRRSRGVSQQSVGVQSERCPKESRVPYRPVCEPAFTAMKGLQEQFDFLTKSLADVCGGKEYSNQCNPDLYNHE